MLLANAIAPRATGGWGPLDNRWYNPWLDLGTNDSGVSVGPETIFRCGVVLAAVRFKAYSVAVCTAQVGARLAGGRRQPTPDHPAQVVLRNPNAWQTAFEWTLLNVLRLSTWGNAYNRIVAGPGYFARELRPLHPARMSVLGQAADGSLIYEYRPPEGGEPETLSQSEVLHYRDLSLDGFSGMQTFQLIRNAVGVALAAEKHSATFLRKGTRLSGILSKENDLTPEMKTQLSESWAASFGGGDNVGGVAVLGGGFKFQPLAIDHQKAQFIELQNHQVEAILMALGVPGVVVGYQGDQAATYASAEAFFEKGGVKHCVLPIVMNMEQRDEKALLLEGDGHYIKRNLDVLQRANIKDRYEAYYKATGRPWLTGNEVRATDDLNPDPDPSMDKVLLPVNMATGENTATGERAEAEPPPAPQRRRPAPMPPPPEEEDAEAARLSAAAWQFASDTAARVVRREIAAIKGGSGKLGAAQRYAKDPAAWRAWVVKFYDEHSAHVTEALHVAPEAARSYAESQRDALLTSVAVIETWEASRVPMLAEMAIREAHWRDVFPEEKTA